MAGPLVAIDTQIAGINLDISRSLMLGPTVTLSFMRPDSTVTSGWNVLKILTANFDRVVGDELTRGDGKTVVFQVADIDGDLNTILRHKELYISCLGVIYKVDRVPLLADNEAQVFTIYCQTRTLKNTFFEERK